MTKEQFWRIIEDVNAVSQNHDQETVWTRIVENLSHYPLEDIMDWHLIYHEYKDAAYRDEMFAVSTALGSDYADEGLNNFRAWLISCGKEVFMNALREPVTLVDSPKKDGCFNYGKYDYAAFYAYNAKMFRIDPDSTQDLIYALEDYTLDRETIEDIHEELPKQQGFGQNGVGASFANYYSPNCGKNNAPQSDAIQALMDSGEVVHAYVYSNGGREEFLFHNTPENIASFIGSRPFVDQKLIRYSYSSGGKSFACQPFNIASLFTLITQLGVRMAETVIENQDFEVLIKHYDRPDSFFYLDPPYYTSEYVYDCGFTWEDHLRLHRALSEAQGQWLISYNDCPEIRELYGDFNQFGFSRIHSMVQKYEAGKEFPELLVGNYDLYGRERDKPRQMTLFEAGGGMQPGEIDKILKECIISCKIKR